MSQGPSNHQKEERDAGLHHCHGCDIMLTLSLLYDCLLLSALTFKLKIHVLFRGLNVLQTNLALLKLFLIFTTFIQVSDSFNKELVFVWRKFLLRIWRIVIWICNIRNRITATFPYQYFTPNYNWYPNMSIHFKINSCRMLMWRHYWHLVYGIYKRIFMKRTLSLRFKAYQAP